ncbi:MAG: hypothetical protein IJC88_04690 [Oscillospiraceae bacterium]|nr:hypothetical protein [Oscillospiraceae bacterium]
MKNASILVLTDPKSPSYAQYTTFLRPYLDWFGFPYDERPITSSGSMDYALILLAHPDMTATAPALRAVRMAYDNGTGLAVFDSALALALGVATPKTAVAEGGHILISPHEISSLHPSGDSIALFAAHTYSISASVGDTVASLGTTPLLEAGNRIVLWHDMGWMNPSVCGPLMGLDDLLWKSLVFAARKPIVMQGLPPFVGMRVDDVWGAWREFDEENPLSWVDIANSYGLIPWLGVFQNNVNEATLKQLQKHAKAGTATMFPHAFAGCEWVPSDLPEHFIWFDHFAGKPYDDATIKENAIRAKSWFSENGLPISKLALAHYYETGKNALPYLVEMGCEFIGVHMTPSTPYRNEDPQWVKCGPYRTVLDGPHNGKHPVFYADYLPDDPRLFNCVTEIRDVCGYEWSPTSNVEKTVRDGIRQITRALQSLVPAVFFTHESAWIQRMSPNTVKASFDGVFSAIEGYEPIPASMDEICGYVRAKVGIKLLSAESDGTSVKLSVSGKNDRETKFTLFTEQGAKTLTLPAVSGETALSI